MREWKTDRIAALAQENLCRPEIPLPFRAELARSVARFHEQLPGYDRTPLRCLSALAEKLGVAQICVKDESQRFSLNAFKGLGGAYAMFRILCSRFSLDPERTRFEEVRRLVGREKGGEIEFVTCTDGNHGRGVSWAAGLFGCRAHIYMPVGTHEVRAEAIRRVGPAEVVVTELCYDDTVRYARRQSEENGWVLIQDTSWDGYEQIPTWIIQGYLTLAAEAAAQMDALSLQPTHVFLQAGVGSMAGGVLSYLIDRYGKGKLVAAVVEPRAADCHYASAKAGDGLTHSVEGGATIMAGLNCGTPCSLTWPILRDHASFFLSCEDVLAEEGMRAYAAGLGGDPKIVSGESGAATLGAVLCVLSDKELGELRAAMGLNGESVLLLINTEGDTDPDNYRRVLTTGETAEH